MSYPDWHQNLASSASTLQMLEIYACMTILASTNVLQRGQVWCLHLSSTRQKQVDLYEYGGQSSLLARLHKWDLSFIERLQLIKTLLFCNLWQINKLGNFKKSFSIKNHYKKS